MTFKWRKKAKHKTTDIVSSIIYNGPKLETIQMPMRMNKLRYSVR